MSVKTSAMPIEAPSGLFTCPNHQGGLMLTPKTCASMWERARRSQADALVRLAPCVGCHIGASNAGVKVKQVASKPKPGDGLSCVRCGSGGRRLVGGRLCVSCYNREREYLAGRNAKGDAPTQHRPLFCAVAGVVGDAGDVRPVRVDMVASYLEARIVIARSLGLHQARVVFGPPGQRGQRALFGPALALPTQDDPGPRKYSARRPRVPRAQLPLTGVPA